MVENDPTTPSEHQGFFDKTATLASRVVEAQETAEQNETKYAEGLVKPEFTPTTSGSPFIIPISLDDYFKTTPVGSINKAIGYNIKGLNHQQTPTAVPSNWDVYGYTFFTRPQLNLQSDNIRNVRQLYPLLNASTESVQKIVRLTLDPRLQWGYNPDVLFNNLNKADRNDSESGTIGSGIVDPCMSFIPILSNQILSISGWPDLVAPTFTSEKGLYNQTYSQVDGSIKYYETFDMDVTFRNTKGDMIPYMFYIWLWYMSLVFEGYLMPYPDFIAENELDYCTRIYRVTLDPTKTYVRKIAATGASFPISLPMGSFFEFTPERPYNDQNKDLTIRFRTNGVTYFDDILIYEFNKSVAIFRPEIEHLIAGNGTAPGMVKIERNLRQFFNNTGYPFIDPNTYEMQWWIDTDTYESRMSLLNSVSRFYPDYNLTKA